MAVTQTDVKHYLDHAGLVALIKKIKAADAAALKQATDILGITALATTGTGVDTKTVDARLKALEANMGTTSVADQIAAYVQGMDNATGTTSAGGDKVTVKITEADGMIDAITVTESDIASAALLGAVTDDKSKATAFGYIAAEADRAKTAEKANADDIDALEALHAKDGDAFKTVAVEVADGISGIASASKDNGTNDLVKVTVTTEAGSVSAVAVDDSALDAKIGTIPAKVGETATTSVVSYVDAKVAAVNSAVEDLDADFTGANAASSTDGKVTVALKQEDGEITTLTVSTDGDIASADEVAKLAATHAKVGGTGADKDNYQTVAQEAAAAASAAVATVVANAPAAFDTLMEIADWIQKDADGNAETGFDAANRIVALEEKLDATKEGSIAKQVAANTDAIALLNKTDGTAGSVKKTAEDAAAAAIDAIASKSVESDDADQICKVKVTTEDGQIKDVEVTNVLVPCTEADVNGLFDEVTA